MSSITSVLKDYPVLQGSGALVAAAKVKAKVYSEGIATCLAVLIRGNTEASSLMLGLFHYQTGDQERFQKYIQSVKNHIIKDFRSAVIGGYASPAEEPDAGSEEDLEEIRNVFAQERLDITTVYFNPTNTVISDEDQSKSCVNVKIDTSGNFSYKRYREKEWNAL